MKRVFLILLLVNTLLTLQAQPTPEHLTYKRRGKLLDGTPVTSFEKINDTTFVYTAYNYDTKTINKIMTFRDKKFRILHGLLFEQWDDGTIRNAGIYRNNVKVGNWRQDQYWVGEYQNGKRSGSWEKRYDGELVGTITYVAGEPQGEMVYADSTAIKRKIITDTGLIEPMQGTENAAQEEQMPLFPGCDPTLPYDALKQCADKQFLTYIYTRINYPKSCRRKDISGMVLTSFVIEKDGSISDIKAVQAVAKPLSDEVAELVSNMPIWTPGKINGEPVRVQFVLPVQFKLE